MVGQGEFLTLSSIYAKMVSAGLSLAARMDSGELLSPEHSRNKERPT